MPTVALPALQPSDVIPSLTEQNSNKKKRKADAQPVPSSTASSPLCAKCKAECKPKKARAAGDSDAKEKQAKPAVLSARDIRRIGERFNFLDTIPDAMSNSRVKFDQWEGNFSKFLADFDAEIKEFHDKHGYSKGEPCESKQIRDNYVHLIDAITAKVNK
jgi:BRCT domain type II-containing protein